MVLEVEPHLPATSIKNEGKNSVGNPQKTDSNRPPYKVRTWGMFTPPYVTNPGTNQEEALAKKRAEIETEEQALALQNRVKSAARGILNHLIHRK